MAFELYGMLIGTVSAMTGESVKPAYGGDEEAFLEKVVTPIYEVIARVKFLPHFVISAIYIYLCFCIIDLNYVYVYTQEARKSKTERAKHSQWRNYDDLNEYFWY